MAKPAPNLGISKPKTDNATLKNALNEAAVPATHAEGAPAEQEKGTRRRRKSKVKTQLVGAHLSPEVGNQFRMIAAEEVTDVKSLIIEAYNMLFKSRGKPQIASDPIER